MMRRRTSNEQEVGEGIFTATAGRNNYARGSSMLFSTLTLYLQTQQQQRWWFWSEDWQKRKTKTDNYQSENIKKIKALSTQTHTLNLNKISLLHEWFDHDTIC